MRVPGLCRKSTVLQNAEGGENARLLINPAKAQARALVRRASDDLALVEMDAARGGRQIAREEVNQRALPGSVGADYGVQDAPVDLQRDIVDRPQPPKDLLHPARPPAPASL